jgi:hypothetical protein
MSSGAVTYLAEGLCLVLALLLQWAYTWGNAWYESRVGRALVTLAGSIEVIVGVAILRRVFSWGPWAGVVQLGLVVVALAALDIAFLRERRLQRRLQTATKNHRIERSE